tara:strand:- start:576 stop:1184 length:609 start_codon:yes stop_codon:yes gene_type:complete
MKNKIYFYSNVSCKNFFKDLLFEFDLLNLSEEAVNNKSFKNKNILLVVSDEVKITFEKSFFLYNNVVIFSSKKDENLNVEKYTQTTFFYGPVHIKTFLNFLRSCFISNVFVFKDIKIFGETITNINTGLSCTLTTLEKNFLTELIDEKQIKRGYFLEKVLEIKKNIETKTIESHLTRIRKKLSIINSEIQISSKGDVFFVED